MIKDTSALYNVQLTKVYNDKNKTNKKRAQRRHLCAQNNYL